MKRTLLAMAVLALGLGSAQAQDYQMELGGSYADLSSDLLGDDSVLGVDFTYHFAPVKTAGRPLAEAAFLDHSSNLFAGYATADDSDVDAWNIGAEFYMNQFYARAGYTVTDAAGTDADSIEARIGMMLGDGLRLAAGVDRTDVDLPGVDASNDIVLEAKYVSGMGNGTAFNIAGDLTFFDDGGTGIDTTGLNLQGDYYFSPVASVGASYAKLDSDASNADADDFGVSGRFFFTPTFSGELGYNTLADGEVDVISVRLAGRF